MFSVYNVLAAITASLAIGIDVEVALKALEQSLLSDEVKAFRELSITKLGGDYYFAKPRHFIRSQVGTHSDFKFLLTGIAPDELFYKAGQQAFNTNKWLKILLQKTLAGQKKAEKVLFMIILKFWE